MNIGKFFRWILDFTFLMTFQQIYFSAFLRNIISKVKKNPVGTWIVKLKDP